MQGPVGELSERPRTPPSGGNSAMLPFSPPAAVGPACGRSKLQEEEEGQYPPGTKGGRRELYPVFSLGLFFFFGEHPIGLSGAPPFRIAMMIFIVQSRLISS